MALRVHGGTFSLNKVCQGHGSMVPQMHVFFFLRTNAIFFLRTNQALIEFTACTAFALLQRVQNEQSHPVSLANPTGLCVMVQCPDQCASPVLRSHSIKLCLCDYAVALKQDQHLHWILNEDANPARGVETRLA